MGGRAAAWFVAELEFVVAAWPSVVAVAAGSADATATGACAAVPFVAAVSAFAEPFCVAAASPCWVAAVVVAVAAVVSRRHFARDDRSVGFYDKGANLVRRNAVCPAVSRGWIRIKLPGRCKPFFGFGHRLDGITPAFQWQRFRIERPLHDINGLFRGGYQVLVGITGRVVSGDFFVNGKVLIRNRLATGIFRFDLNGIVVGRNNGRPVGRAVAAERAVPQIETAAADHCYAKHDRGGDEAAATGAVALFVRHVVKGRRSQIVDGEIVAGKDIGLVVVLIAFHARLVVIFHPGRRFAGIAIGRGGVERGGLQARDPYARPVPAPGPQRARSPPRTARAR